MSIAEAILVSSLVTAGTSAAVSDRQRRAQNRARDKSAALADRRQKEQQRAAFQAEQQQRQLARNQQSVAAAAARQAQNEQLQQRGISQISQDISQAVLTDAAQR